MDKLFSVIDGIIENRQKAYAIFDFDRTCMNNDIQEMVYIYQAKHFCYKMRSDHFANVIRISDNLRENLAKHRKIVSELEDEIIDLYRFLMTHQTGKTDVALCEISAARHTFYQNMLTLLEIANRECDESFTYQWILRFLERYFEEELVDLSYRVFRLNLAMDQKTIKSHQEKLAPFGHETALRQGVKINQSILGIMRYLRERHVDIYIVSASSCEVLYGVVCNTIFDQLVGKERVLGLHVHKKDLNAIPTIKEGKALVIQKELFPLYENRNPILVAGDSIGDFWMMKMMGNEGIRIVIGDNPQLRNALESSDLDFYCIGENNN